MKQAKISGSGFRGVSIIDSAGAIYTFNEKGEVVFELPTSGAGFDFWKLPDGNFLYCHLGAQRGIRVVTPENEVVMSYVGNSEIFCCQPLDNGFYLAGELTEQRIAIIAPDGSLDHVIPIKNECTNLHEVMRSARKLSNGDYLVVHPGDRKIRRYAESGEVLAEFATRNDTFAAVECGGNHLLYTAQTALCELDENGREVWSVTKEDLPELNIHWLTGMQLLPNGNVIVCNWLGHGREGTGVPIFEVDRTGRLLWTLEAPDFTADPANVQFGSVISGK